MRVVNNFGHITLIDLVPKALFRKHKRPIGRKINKADCIASASSEGTGNKVTIKIFQVLIETVNYVQLLQQGFSIGFYVWCDFMQLLFIIIYFHY